MVNRLRGREGLLFRRLIERDEESWRRSTVKEGGRRSIERVREGRQGRQSIEGEGRLGNI